MANNRHLQKLKQGVKVWNEWKMKQRARRLDLSMTDMSGWDLSSAQLWAVNLFGCNLAKANLRNSVLEWANLSFANLDGADLRNASLAGANLFLAILKGADFRDANLGAVNFSHAYMAGADLNKAVLSGTTFGDNDLSLVKGLDSVQHLGPSIVGIETLHRSSGNISERFLRGTGVPDAFITYAHSLINQVIDFYSCFISYSSKNHNIAERLYADLQSKGVRCWFAPEDIKIGDKFRQRINEAIHIHDKLLLILSKESIASEWVEEEVESALEKERKRKQTVLFPIRVDGGVIKSKKAWASSLRRTRHIGDFSQWKDQDSYSKAFERLLRDLKAEDKA